MSVKTFGDEQRRRELERRHRHAKRSVTEALILGIGISAFLGLLLLPFLYPDLLKEQPQTYNVTVTFE